MFELTPILSLKTELTPGISPLSKSILKTLIYFSIFQYPLTANEIFSFCSIPNLSLNDIKNELNNLKARQLVRHTAGFYHLGNNSSITRRKNGNDKAKLFLKRARLMSSLISRFPFVKCVCLSGSLSKGYIGRAGDIDYFVITTPNRLWICRSLLMLFKKIVLLNSKKYFCINYFISSDNLEIPDKNIFTATEITTLVPLYNFSLYESFINSNKWAEAFYPHYHKADGTKVLKTTKNFIKRGLEKLLAGKTGEKLDSYFFRLTLKQWKKKFPDFNPDEFDLNMRSKKNVSKHHPRGFQFKVLQQYESAIKVYENQFHIQLT